MIAIQDVLVSDDIVKKEFVCNLNACKGACCWKGDFGAPVSIQEQKTISKILPNLKPYLSLESNKLLEEKGAFAEYDNGRFTGTSLHDNGACIFMKFDKNGTAQCGIEEAYNKGDVKFKKPISCHLYPIRVTVNKEAGFEAWNYDTWDICSPACSNGEKLQVPLYVFLKNAIVKAKGEDFYNELAAAAEHLQE